MKSVFRLLIVSIATLSFWASPSMADSRSEALAEIESLKEEIATLEASNSGAVQLSENLSRLREDIETMKSEVLRLEQEMQDLAYLLGIYRSSYRVVTRIGNGTPLGTLQLSNGTVIENAMFSGTARGGIQVATANGSFTVPVSQIPAAHADKFNLPPAIPLPEQSPQMLMTKRPNQFLGALVAASDGGESGGEKSKEGSEDRMTPSERSREYDAIQERNKVRWNRIGELKDESRRLYAKKKALLIEQREKKSEFDSQRIKPDRNMVESVLNGYARQIEAAETRDREISQEIRKIRGEIE